MAGTGKKAAGSNPRPRATNTPRSTPAPDSDESTQANPSSSSAMLWPHNNYISDY